MEFVKTTTMNKLIDDCPYLNQVKQREIKKALPFMTLRQIHVMHTHDVMNEDQLPVHHVRVFRFESSLAEHFVENRQLKDTDFGSIIIDYFSQFLKMPVIYRVREYHTKSSRYYFVFDNVDDRTVWQLAYN